MNSTVCSGLVSAVVVIGREGSPGQGNGRGRTQFLMRFRGPPSVGNAPYSDLDLLLGLLCVFSGDSDAEPPRDSRKGSSCDLSGCRDCSTNEAACVGCDDCSMLVSDAGVRRQRPQEGLERALELTDADIGSDGSHIVSGYR